MVERGRLGVFVKRTLLSYDGSHDIEHARRVSANAAHIFSGPSGDMHAAVAAAFAHDTCDAKYDGLRRLEPMRHACLASGMSDDEALCVKRVVEHVSFSRLRYEGPPLLRLSKCEFGVWQCVSDADILEAMGATGMIRTLMYQGHCGCDIDAALDSAQYSLLECIHYLHHKCARNESAGTRRCRWIGACVLSLPLREMSREIMLRGRRGSGFASAERLLLRSGRDEVLQHMAAEASREARWTVALA